MAQGRDRARDTERVMQPRVIVEHCIRCGLPKPHEQRYVYTPSGKQFDARVCLRCSTIKLVLEVVPVQR